MVRRLLLVLGSITNVYSYVGGVVLLFLQAVVGFIPQLKPGVLKVGDSRRLHWKPLGRTMRRSTGQMAKVGAYGLPIGAMIMALVSLSIAWPTADMLKKFGTGIFIADILAIGLTSQMTPLMMAILAAGRSGSGIAAEIGTMQVTEEITAMKAMGVNPVHTLVIPRLVGMIVGLMTLTVIGIGLGILVGGVVAKMRLGLTWQVYYDQVLKVLSATEATFVRQGVLKSFTFAATIATVSCYRGFQVKGGSEAVGRAATAAVVDAIFLIILINTVFTIYYSQG